MQVTLVVLQDVLVLLVQVFDGLCFALSEWFRSRGHLLRESLSLLLDLWSEESASVWNTRLDVHALVSHRSHWLLSWPATGNHELCLLLKCFVLILVKLQLHQSLVAHLFQLPLILQVNSALHASPVFLSLLDILASFTLNDLDPRTDSSLRLSWLSIS